MESLSKDELARLHKKTVKTYMYHVRGGWAYLAQIDEAHLTRISEEWNSRNYPEDLREYSPSIWKKIFG